MLKPLLPKIQRKGFFPKGPVSVIAKLATVLLVVITLPCIAMKAEAKSSSDSTAPTEITADHVEFDDTEGTAFYKGNVVSKQGSRLLRSETLKISRGDNNQIKVMHATGHPSRFQAQPDPQKPMGFGKAKDIKYYPQEDKAVLVGDAELEQNGDVIKGPEIVYYFSTGKMISSSSPQGRTTVVIQSRKGD